MEDDILTYHTLIRADKEVAANENIGSRKLMAIIHTP